MKVEKSFNQRIKIHKDKKKETIKLSFMYYDNQRL